MRKINRKLGILLMCFAELAVGILLLIDPAGFTSGIIVMLGIVLTATGVGSIIQYFHVSPEEAAQTNCLSKGLVLGITGLFCIFKSNWFIATFPLLTVIYGILTLAGGICKVQWAVDMLRAKRRYWFAALTSAVLTLIFAALILTNPFTSTAFLWTFIAVAWIIEAITDIITFLFSRVSARENTEEGENVCDE